MLRTSLRAGARNGLNFRATCIGIDQHLSRERTRSSSVFIYSSRGRERRRAEGKKAKGEKAKGEKAKGKMAKGRGSEGRWLEGAREKALAG